MRRVEEIKRGLQKILAQMDELVVGHDEVKTALLLGLLSREHIYLEGPTGSAKTMLAEIVARAAGLNFFFYQMHRDTRINELLGDVVIQKRDGPDGTEIIGQKIIKGGILTCQVAVLDDISRAPGESLNILLRILNERKYLDEDIDLFTAIATSNPTLDDYYNEPLDPANLDRFVLQARSQGLLSRRAWDEAESLLNTYSHIVDPPEAKVCMKDGFFIKAYKVLAAVKVPDEFISEYLAFLRELFFTFGADPDQVLISDRTFLVKSLKVMRAYALMNGRAELKTPDLKALNYMTAFRLPEDKWDQVREVIDNASQGKK
jgi:MoxR-like ATPase